MSTATPSVPARRKAHRRWVIVGVLLLLLAAIPVGFYFLTGWLRDRELAEIYAALDAEDPNWRWPDLIASLPPPPPDDRNAALQVLKVADLLHNSGLKLPWKRVQPNQRNARLSEGQAQALRAVFSTLGPNFLEEARKLKDLPEGRFPWATVENPFDPEAARFVNHDTSEVMRLLQLDATLLGHDGEMEAAAESCQALLHAVHAINDSPGLMAHLIRLEDLASWAIECTLGQGAVSPARLQALQAALVAEADSDGFYHAMRGERAIDHQHFVLVREGKMSWSALGAGIYPSSVNGAFVDLFPGWFLGNHADMLRHRNEQVRVSKLKDKAQAAAFRALEQKKVKDAWDFPFMNAKAQSGTQASLRCAITAVAAERYRLAHGRWPGGADDLLKAGLLAESYKDPFDGQPLRWKITPTGLIVYSVGSDMIDHGGILYRGSRVPGGHDIGFELWLPSFRGIAPPPPEVQGK